MRFHAIFPSIKFATPLERRIKAYANYWFGLSASPTELNSRVVPDRDRYGIAVVAIVKNEENYIEEWLAFHSHAGVRSFIIYDNGCSDSTIARISSDKWRNKVRVVPWVNFGKHIRIQNAAYNHAIANFGRQYRWMTFIDVDEFLVPKDCSNLNDIMADYADLPGLSLPWQMFGPNGHETRPAGLVIENYTSRALWAADDQAPIHINYKSIVDPAQVRCAHTHYCEFWDRPKIMFNDAKRQFMHIDRFNSQNATSERIQLNHYFTRSLEEFQRKLDKGRVSKEGRLNNQGTINLKAQILRAPVVADDIAARFAPAIKAILQDARTETLKVADPV